MQKRTKEDKNVHCAFQQFNRIAAAGCESNVLINQQKVLAESLLLRQRNQYTFTASGD